MRKRLFARAVAWQLCGIAVLMLAALTTIGETLWWTFFFYDRSILNDIPFHWIVHVMLACSVAGLLYYRRTTLRRERAIAMAANGLQFDSLALSFRVGPFPVSIEITFFLMTFVLGAMGGGVLRTLAFVVSATIAVLAHELAHAAAARMNGHSGFIRLHALGGTTTHFGRTLTRGGERFIAAAGPVTGLLLGGAAFGAAHAAGVGGAMVQDFVFVNAGWATMNLLPVLPLDGGVVLASFIRKPALAELIGAAVAGTVATAALLDGEAMVALMFANFCFHNVTRAAAARGALSSGS